MEKNKCGSRYSPEMRERAVRMVFEHQGEFETQSAAIMSIAPKIGYLSNAATLNRANPQTFTKAQHPCHKTVDIAF